MCLSQLVTRAVRVIDLITNLDMSAFHSLGGWSKMLNRLELEVAQCRLEVPFVLPTTVRPASNPAGSAPGSASSASQGASSSSSATATATETGLIDGSGTDAAPSAVAMDTTEQEGGVSRYLSAPVQTVSKPCSSGVLYSCMPERAALIKSILNFLKKAIPEPTFSENMRTCEYTTSLTVT